MTQLIINIDNPELFPSITKMLGKMEGVSIAKTMKIKNEKKAVLESIEIGYNEAKQAQAQGKKLPELNSLIEELKAE